MRKATSIDPVLSKVVLYTQRGWPRQIDDKLKPYANRQSELSVEAGCLLWGMRVVVPTLCQKTVLRELHTSHPGIVRMKSLARIHVWWPLIDKDIEQLVRECKSCQSVRNNPPSTMLHLWSWPDRPWMRIHVLTQEVIPMKSTTTEKTLEVLRNLFAAYGLPEQLVSDNSPQFTSSEFELCMRANGIKHI